ncbi:hypothetical protein [Roseateles sp. P5_E4]
MFDAEYGKAGLPPQTRKLLTLLREWAREQCQAKGVTPADLRFTRRELREALRWGDTQLKVHLARLQEMEFPGRAPPRAHALL